MLRLLLATTLLFAGCVQLEEPGASTTPSDATKEMTYEPKQCRTNPWQSESDNAPERSDAEAQRIVEHFQSKDVTVGEVRFVQQYEAVCDACHCPRGDWIHAQIDSADSERARGLGWRHQAASAS